MLSLTPRPLPNFVLSDLTPDFNGLDKLMNDLFKQPVPVINGASFAAPLDIIEKKEAYLVSAELPGVEDKDLSISIEDGELTIEAQKSFVKSEDVEAYHRVERSYGSVRRVLRLPESVDSEAIQAAFKNGVLTLTLPKQAEAQKKRIEVKVN